MEFENFIGYVYIFLVILYCICERIWQFLKFINPKYSDYQKISNVQLFPEILLNRSEKLSEIFIDNLPVPEYKPKNFDYIETENSLKNTIDELKNKQIIGVDIEFDSIHSYTGKICLIQISSNEKTYLIDAIKIPNKILGNSLKEIFYNPNIIKVFHDCRSDLNRLKSNFPEIIVQNIFDTYYFAGLLGNLESLGLQKLLSFYCKYNISKEEKLNFQKSDWSQRPLTKEQLEYASVDSYFLIYIRHKLLCDYMRNNDENELYEKLLEFQEIVLKRQAEFKDENPQNGWIKAFKTKICTITEKTYVTEKILEFLWIKRDNFAKEKNLNSEIICTNEVLIRIALHLPNTEDLLINFMEENKFDENSQKYIKSIEKELLDEINEKLEILSKNPEKLKNNSIIMNIKNEEKAQKEALQRKSMRRDFIKTKYQTKRPVYENCRLYGPDDELLCHCDRDKVNWYIKKGLAHMICEDPLSAKLSFVPNGRANRNPTDIENDKYYADSRKNVCVVCGSEENLRRYHVVPVIYRQEFPEKYKSHRSHDVVLLCFACQEKTGKYIEDLKKFLSEKYSVPLILIEARELIRKINAAKKMCKTLTENTNKISEERKKAIEKQFSELIKEISNEKPDWNKDSKGKNEIEQILEVKLPEESRNLHGKKVVEQIGDLEEFIKMWRRVFLEKMQPKYMPNGWSVDHRVDRTFGKLSTFEDGRPKI